MQVWFEKVSKNRWFFAGVVLPVLLSTVYYALIASGQYVSESRFVIKAPNQRGGQISTFANLIQTTGLSAGQEQADQVIDYVRSRTALQKLSARLPVKQFYGRDTVDPLSAFPLPWQQDAFEDLYTYYRGKVQISHDSETGLVRQAKPNKSLSRQRRPVWPKPWPLPADPIQAPAIRVRSLCSASPRGGTGKTFQSFTTLT